MSEETARALLSFILHQAAPDEQDSDIVYEHLARAEELAREQGICV